MNKVSLIKLTAMFASILLFANCHQTKFRNIAEAPQQAAAVPEPTPAPPVEPPPVIEPPEPTLPPVVTPEPPTPIPPVPVTPPVVVPVTPPPVQKSGLCANDSSTQLLSCLKCHVPMNPPIPPQFSEKGQALIDIMAIGCAVPNKSAPKGYVAPTKEQLIARLSRLSPTFYPDSAMSTAQKNVISGLQNDPNLQKKLFGGLWYQPPYSDSVETYFGVSVAELVQGICYQTMNIAGNNPSEIHSIEYIKCMDINPFSCKENGDYTNANTYREQLRLAMRESIKNPYVAPPPTPAKKCNWESFEGEYEQGAKEVLARWLVSGFKIGIEIGSLAGKCEPVTALPSGSNEPRGKVKMSGYICK